MAPRALHARPRAHRPRLAGPERAQLPEHDVALRPRRARPRARGPRPRPKPAHRPEHAAAQVSPPTRTRLDH
eukprot:4944608-Alexandrium_andersonii.AAC.1